MRTPKHLWSGDWERDSADASEELAALVELPRVATPGSEPEPVPEPAPRVPGTPSIPGAGAARERARASLTAARARLSGFHLRPAVAGAVALGIVALVALAAGAYAVGALLASSGSTAPSAGGPSGPMTWLGMEVETQSPAGVVVATVAPGSAAEQAGIEPGDIIVQVNNRTVNATGDIGKAIAGLTAGQQVQVQVSRGSTPYTTTVTLGAAPASYP